MTSSARVSRDGGTANGLSGFAVDGQLQFRRLLNRQITPLLPIEHSAEVDTKLVHQFDATAFVSHEPYINKFAVWEDGWDPMT
jgi:hypothetical protein